MSDTFHVNRDNYFDFLRVINLNVESVLNVNDISTDMISSSDPILITSTSAAPDAIELLAPNGGIEVNAPSGEIALSGDEFSVTTTSAAADSILLDATAGGVSIDAAGASNFSTSSGDLTLSVTGGTATDQVIINSNGTGNPGSSPAIDINASGGGIEITAASIMTIESADDMTFFMTGTGTGEQLSFESDGTGPSAIRLSTSGGIDAAAVGRIELFSRDTSKWQMAANDATVQKLTIQAINTGAGTGNLDLLADDAIAINGTSGGVSIDAGAASNFTTTAGDLDLSAAGTLDLDGTTAVEIDSAGGVSIDAGAASNFTTTAGDLDLSAAGTLDLDGTTAVEIDSAGQVSLTSSQNAVDAISINATGGTGGVTIASAGAGAGGNIVLQLSNATSAEVSIEATNASGGAHLRSEQLTAPVVTDDGVNFTGAALAVGTDMAGKVTFNDSAGGAGTITVTFTEPYQAAPYVVITAADQALTPTSIYVTTGTTVFRFNGTGTTGGANAFFYQVIGA